MKTRALWMAAAMVLTAMATTRVAQAQQPLVINIPFDFVAGDKTLPAGDYALKSIGTAHTLILMDRKASTTSAVLTTTPAAKSEPQSESKLVFNRYGDRYFLSQVWTAGYANGRQLLKSDSEKEIAQIARVETQSQVTIIAELPPTNR